MLFLAPVTVIEQYGVTWTLSEPAEAGQYVTGDWWVVGPVEIESVTPAPTGTRNGSTVNPRGGRQGYDDRGGEFDTADNVTFPRTFAAGESLVSSVSQPEDVTEVRNVGALVSQAVLTVVASPRPAGAFRPSYAGTYKAELDASAIRWDQLATLPAPGGGGPDMDDLLHMADRPRIDHLSSWTIQDSCAHDNWYNGEGQHACYGREVGTFVSEAALAVFLDTPQREELVRSMIQHGIDNYGVVRAGGTWLGNGGHHNGRKWPIVFAARLLGDCDMLAVGADYDDSTFGEDSQTYAGVGGTARFGWDCGGGQGSFFEDGCTGGGAQDCRDPAGLQDGCPPYRDCCTSAYWVGEALSALMLDGKRTWNHDPFFDYVDRWMAGDVGDTSGASSSFVEAMWAAHRTSLPTLPATSDCGAVPTPDAGGPGPGGPDGGSGADGGGAGADGGGGCGCTVGGGSHTPRSAGALAGLFAILIVAGARRARRRR